MPNFIALGLNFKFMVAVITFFRSTPMSISNAAKGNFDGL